MTRDSDIAVVGMAGRFPGAPDLTAFWTLLREGREGISRLDATGEAEVGHVPAAAVLDGIAFFDAGLFGIGRREAELMDPQLRILLETAWHALEDAAVDPARPPGAIGVFVGSAISTYLLSRLRRQLDQPSAAAQLLTMTGNDKDYTATQLAYRLDLKGPAVSVQTACSSSLVAVHLACQSLLSGECDIAIAGGVSVRVPHRVGYRHEPGGMMSPDGHCRSFAEDAAGTVFGSGCGVVVLRRLADAGNDRVRAVIHGSAVNNDGSRKIGFTAPSQDQQAAVIAEAMAVAGLDGDALGYIEGHGTGTSLGDPIEVRALAAALAGAARGVRLGSVKSNVGHLETAAGVTGLIKTVLMLEHETMVPTLHAATPSRSIPWDETPFILPQAAEPWRDRQVAGVSSFGVGGTNAHVVVGRAPAAPAPAAAADPYLVISAQDPAALRELVGAYRLLLDRDPSRLAALAAAAARRPRLGWWVGTRSVAELERCAPRQGSAPRPPVVPGPPASLPLYPFQRARFWVEDGGLLQPAIRTPFDAVLRVAELDPARQPWLRDHVVEGTVIAPAALYLALLAEAGIAGVADLTIHAPLPIAGPRSLQLWQDSGRVRIGVGRETGWDSLMEARPEQTLPLLPVWKVAATTEMTGAEWDRRMAGAGLAFGPAFRLLDVVAQGAAGVSAGLRSDADANAVTLLDAGLQALGATVSTLALGFRPTAIARFSVTGPITATSTVLARLTEDASESKTGDVLWLDASGGMIACAEGIVCRRVRAPLGDMIHRLVWRAQDDGQMAAAYAVLEEIAQGYVEAALRAVPEPSRRVIARRLARHAGGRARDPDDAMQVLSRDHPAHAAEAALIARCGTALPAVLAGRTDPLDLLFSEGHAEAAYTQSPVAARMNAAVAAVVAGTRPRRVLEIGGGTGATTDLVLPALPDDASYLFTDLSPAFLTEAATRHSRLSTAILDIGADPAGQGIAPGTRDLVIAANVLHAAPDLTLALRHAVSLLAPGGRLLLVEGTAPLARLDMTFGLTDAWGQQADPGLRPDHPLVSVAAWRDLLRDAGLTDIVVVAELAGQAVLTASLGGSGWVAVGREAALAKTLGLDFVSIDAPLPAGLTGVLALVGLEAESRIADLLTLGRALAVHVDAPRLLVPTRAGEALDEGDRPDPARAALGGFARTLGREHPALRPCVVDLDDLSAAIIGLERALDDGEDRVAWRRGTRLIPRLEPAPVGEVPPEALTLDADLHPVAAERLPPGPGQVEIRVRAAGLNFKDALMASGAVRPASAPGGECAGEIVAIGAGVAGFSVGDAVLAVVAGSLATHVLADWRLVRHHPAGLSFAQAASLPIAGATAWFALRVLAPVAAGQRILIHAATGGVGGIAMQLALAAGATVVATAGSDAKRGLLVETGVSEVYSSRNTDFADIAPVDTVIGAMAAGPRRVALRRLKPGGHYIEIGRTDVLTDLEVVEIRPDIKYSLVALDAVDAATFGALLDGVLAAVAENPALLPRVTTLPLTGVRGAVASMLRGEHIGKLVALPPMPGHIRSDGTYLVTGAGGGLGPAIMAWLARRGAGAVVGLARRPPPPGHPAAERIVIGDVADRVSLLAVDAFVAARGLPKVRGVIHAAGVLEDALVERLDPGQFARVSSPKSGGLAAILAHWPDLDLCVAFSSAGGLFGSAGQAPHTAAAAALDAAVAEARGAGRPVIALDWGAWREIGAARAAGPGLAAAGMGTIAPDDAFAALDAVLRAGLGQAAILPIDWPVLRAVGPVPPLLRDRGSTDAAVAAPVPKASIKPTSRAALEAAVTAACAGLLTEAESPDPRRPLHDLGLDSLGSLELRNRLGRLVDQVLPATVLFDYPTVATLSACLAERLGLSEETSKPVVPGDEDDFDAMSEDDLDAMLAGFERLHTESPT